MTEKRFERIYEDVDVFCRDHNAKGISQLLGKEDYDTIVDLMNDLDTDLMNARSRNTRLILLLKDVVLLMENHSDELVKLAKYLRKNGNLEFNSGRTYDD